MTGRSARLLGSALVLSACAALWWRQGDTTARVSSHLVLFACAFGAYLVALEAARGLSGSRLRVCIAVAIGWRLVLVMAPPLLSDDIYRSVWEGRVQNAGGNPYAWADRAEGEKWRHLRDETWERMNHKRYTAIYPPLWQLAARVVVAVHDSVAAMKAFLVACEVLAWWPLAVLLRRRRLPRERLLVAAWSPVALVEIAGSGHNEPLAVLFLVLALLALEQGRPALAALAAGAGALAKLLPALVAAAWSRRFRVWHTPGPLIVAALLFWPFMGAGRGLWRSLVDYSHYWRFNESLFAALVALGGSHAAGLRLGGALLALLALGLAWRRAETSSAALAMMVAWLAVIPNVLPWYALWLLPLLALRHSAAALALTGTLQMAYLVYPRWLAGWPWHVGWEVRAVEYGIPLAIACWDQIRRSRSAPTTAEAAIAA